MHSITENLLVMKSEKETEILESAGELFKRYGIKSLTMSDIARELKISKKTLYKFVTDKNDLVIKSMSIVLDKQECEFEEISAQVEDPIEELIQISQLAEKHLKSIHPSVIFDIQKFHPQAWEQFECHKDNHIYLSVMDNLERGKKKKVYRQELNSAVIAKLFISRFDILFDPYIFPHSDFDLAAVNKEMMSYHLHAILSEKGKKQLEEYNF